MFTFFSLGVLVNQWLVIVIIITNRDRGQVVAREPVVNQWLATTQPQARPDSAKLRQTPPSSAEKVVSESGSIAVFSRYECTKKTKTNK